MVEEHQMTIRVLVSVLAVATVLGGCAQEGRDINDNPNAGTIQQQFDTLTQRPDIEEATEQWLALIDEVQQALRTTFGLPEWVAYKEDPIGRAGCGFDFPDIGGDGETRQIDGGYSEAPIPDENWDEAVTTVAAIAEKYGFTKYERMNDRTGYHDLDYLHPDGSRLLLGTQKNTTLAISSGCHLTAAAKRRGKPEEPSITWPSDLGPEPT
jgi:hypothetical protein